MKQLLLMFCMLKKKKTYPAYLSKHNSNCQKQVILLMISNSKKWHYLAVKKLSELLREVTSKNRGDFYCQNCLHSFKIENNLNCIKEYVKIKIFVM